MLYVCQQVVIMPTDVLHTAVDLTSAMSYAFIVLATYFDNS